MFGLFRGNLISKALAEEFEGTMKHGLDTLNTATGIINRLHLTKISTVSKGRFNTKTSLDDTLAYLDIHVSEVSRLLRVFKTSVGATPEVLEMYLRLDALRESGAKCKRDLQDMSFYGERDDSLGVTGMSEVQEGETSSLVDLSFDSFMVYFEQDFKADTKRIQSGYQSIITNYYLDVRSDNFISYKFAKQIADVMHNVPYDLYTGTHNHESFWRGAFTYPYIKVYLLDYFLGQINFHDKYNKSEEIVVTGIK